MHTLTESTTNPLKTNFCLEQQLLLYTTRTVLDGATSERLKTLIQKNFDWAALLQLAVQHRVIPLMYVNLKNICPEAVPPYYFEQLQRAFQANSRQNLLFTQELLRLLRLFQEQEYPALAFKGPILALTVYGNLSLRQISDLDILLDERYFEKATDLLIERNYQLRTIVPWEKHLIRQDGFYNIDLHQTIAPKHLSHALRSEDVWQQLESIQFAGTTLHTLSPEMNLLVLCLHGTKECWNSLHRICDVSELIRTQSLDWQKVIALANAQGWRRLIGLGLVLAMDLLAAELPEEVERWVKTEPLIDKLSAQVKQQLFSETIPLVDEVERTLFHIRTRERIRDRFWALWGLMNHSRWLTPTSNDKNFIKIPSALAFLYYLLRPIRVLRKYWGVIQKQFEY